MMCCVLSLPALHDALLKSSSIFVASQYAGVLVLYITDWFRPVYCKQQHVPYVPRDVKYAYSKQNDAVQQFPMKELNRRAKSQRENLRATKPLTIEVTPTDTCYEHLQQHFMRHNSHPRTCIPLLPYCVATLLPNYLTTSLPNLLLKLSTTPKTIPWMAQVFIENQ